MNPDRKSLDRWARSAGYNDFLTYIRAGNSILDARHEIQQRIASLQAALAVLNGDRFAPTKNPVTNEEFGNPPLELPKKSDEPTEPPDPKNAHPQGDQA